MIDFVSTEVNYYFSLSKISKTVLLKYYVKIDDILFNDVGCEIYYAKFDDSSSEICVVGYFEESKFCIEFEYVINTQTKKYDFCNYGKTIC